MAHACKFSYIVSRVQFVLSVLRRMYEMNKEAVNEAIMKRMLKEQLEKERQCL